MNRNNSISYRTRKVSCAGTAGSVGVSNEQSFVPQSGYCKPSVRGIVHTDVDPFDFLQAILFLLGNIKFKKIFRIFLILENFKRNF